MRNRLITVLLSAHGIALLARAACWAAVADPLWIQQGASVGWRAEFFDESEFGWFNNSAIAPCDRDGSCVVAGGFRGKVAFGPGPRDTLDTGAYIPPLSDLFVARYDTAGRLLWAAKAEPDWEITANAVASYDDGSCAVAGSFKHKVKFGANPRATLDSPGSGLDLFVAKYDPRGEIVWTAQAELNDPHAEIIPNSIASYDDGSCVVTGTFTSTVTLGPGPKGTLSSEGVYDLFVAKYDSTGALLHARQAGGDSTIIAGLGVASYDRDGSYVVTGRFSGEFSFGGATLYSPGGWNLFVAKYTALGELRWATQAEPGDITSEISAFGIASYDADGSCVVTGGFNGTVEFDHGWKVASAQGDQCLFVAKYDDSGRVAWATQSRTVLWDISGYRIASCEDGSCIVTGSFIGTHAFGLWPWDTIRTPGLAWDVFVAKYDAAGAPLWVIQSEARGGEVTSSAVAAYRDGSFAVMGYFYGKVGFGTRTLTSAGIRDLYVAKFFYTPPMPRFEIPRRMPHAADLWRDEVGGGGKGPFRIPFVGPGDPLPPWAGEAIQPGTKSPTDTASVAPYADRAPFGVPMTSAPRATKQAAAPAAPWGGSIATTISTAPRAVEEMP